MQNAIYYVTHNMSDVMFAVALVCFTYAVSRMFKVRQSIALSFAFTPLILAWAMQNAATRQFMLAHIL